MELCELSPLKKNCARQTIHRKKEKKKKGINIISGGPRGALVIIEIKQGGETYSD
jgi:hypothetical protein